MVEGGTRDGMELPRWIAVVMVVSLLTVGAALLYLYRNYDQVPDPMPIHWSLSGKADRFVVKTPAGVFRFGLVAAVLWTAMAGFTAVSARRGPRTERLVFVAKFQAVLTVLISLMLVCVIVNPLGPLPPYLVAVLGLLIAVYVVWGMVKLSSLAAAPGDETPDSAWLWGLFYRNPEDPRWMVEKRSGLGYTLNFAHWAAWLILGLLTIGVASAVLLSFLA